MVKAAAVKGMAVRQLQPVLSNPVPAKAGAEGLEGPPAKAAAKAKAAGKAPARPRQSMSDLQNAIADKSGLPPKECKVFLEALRDVAAKTLRETSVFKLHNIVLVRMKKTAARNASTRSMFGKEVVLMFAEKSIPITNTALVLAMFISLSNSFSTSSIAFFREIRYYHLDLQASRLRVLH